MIIYHITPRSDWEQALREGSYRADSLAREGFIHCSTREQVLDTALRYYRGQGGLVLLCIETEHLGAPLRYENLLGGETLFPHLYGALALEAITAALPFPPKADGSFEFPIGSLT